MTTLALRSPAHPRGGCAGFVFVIALALAGCQDATPSAEPIVLDLDGDTVRLPPGVRLVEVSVRAGATEFEPAAPAARVGDVIRFTAQDGGSHAIAFQGGQLTAHALEFLERSGQLRAPPLLHQGASWIVSLTGAPAGEYPFRCLTHGAHGRLIVTAAS